MPASHQPVPLLLLLSSAFANSRLQSHFEPPTTSFSKCLTKLTDTFLVPNESIWLSSDQPCSDLFTDAFLQTLFSQNHTLSITFGALKSNPNSDWVTTKNYIFESSETSDLQSTIESIKFLHSWNSTARFFIVAGNIYNESEKVLAGMVEVLWYEGIYDFVLVTPDRNNSELINIFTWFPYRCKSGTDYSKIQLLDACHDGTFVNGSQLFPRKIPRRFRYYCKLEVGTVEWPPYVMKPVKRVDNTDQYVFKEGIEIRLVEAISTKLQLNVSYTMSEKSLNWGLLYSNGTGTGLMAMLRQKKIDMAIGSMTPSLEKLKFFETSESYYYEAFTWCVPHATTQPSWQKILYAISYEIWIAFFVSFLAFSVLLWLISRRRSAETSYRKYINCLQNSLSIALGIAVKNHPKSQILRLITCFWILFSLNFSVEYETSLYSVLTRPTYGYQVDSLDSILRNKFKILFPVNIFNYIDKNTSFSQEINKYSSECTDIKDCYAQVAYNKDTALCLPSSYSNYDVKSYVDDQNIPLIYCFDSNIATYPVMFLMKRGFALKPRFNSIVSRLAEAGFIDVWAQNVYTQKWKDDEMSKLNTTSVDKFLNIERLLTAFVCLAIGWLGASVVFLSELVFYMVRFLKGKQIIII